MVPFGYESRRRPCRGLSIVLNASPSANSQSIYFVVVHTALRLINHEVMHSHGASNHPVIESSALSPGHLEWPTVSKTHQSPGLSALVWGAGPVKATNGHLSILAQAPHNQKTVPAAGHRANRIHSATRLAVPIPDRSPLAPLGRVMAHTTSPPFQRRPVLDVPLQLALAQASAGTGSAHCSAPYCGKGFAFSTHRPSPTTLSRPHPQLDNSLPDSCNQSDNYLATQQSI